MVEITPQSHGANGNEIFAVMKRPGQSSVCPDDSTAPVSKAGKIKCEVQIKFPTENNTPALEISKPED